MPSRLFRQLLCLLTALCVCVQGLAGGAPAWLCLGCEQTDSASAGPVIRPGMAKAASAGDACCHHHHQDNAERAEQSPTSTNDEGSAAINSEDCHCVDLALPAQPGVTPTAKVQVPRQVEQPVANEFDVLFTALNPSNSTFLGAAVHRPPMWDEHGVRARTDNPVARCTCLLI